MGMPKTWGCLYHRQENHTWRDRACVHTSFSSPEPDVSLSRVALGTRMFTHKNGDFGAISVLKGEKQRRADPKNVRSRKPNIGWVFMLYRTAFSCRQLASRRGRTASNASYLQTGVASVRVA